MKKQDRALVRVPKVLIIILNWNNWKDTVECVESLGKISYPDYEIVIVDNGSTNDSERILKKRFPCHKFIQTGKNLGFAGGNNKGIKYALENGADYILILNNDTIVKEDFLEPLVELAESNEQVGICGPIIYSWNRKDQVLFAGAKINTKSGIINLINLRKMDNVPIKIASDYIEGSAMLVKRKVFNDIGLMDARYFIYWEETDFCTRAKMEGYSLYICPESAIWHKGGKAIGGWCTPFTTYYMIRNQLLYFSKLFKINNNIRLRVVSGLFRLVAASAFHRRKNIISFVVAYLFAIWDFYRGKFGESDKFRPAANII